MLQVSLWSLPSLAALLLAALSLRHIRERRRSAGAPALTALALCLLVWSLGQLAGTLTTDLELKLLASALQYPAIPLLPVTWLAFALTYTRRLPRLPRGVLAALCAVPLISGALAWSNSWHGLLWASADLLHGPGFVGLGLTYGPWFWVQVVHSYAAIAIGTFVIIYELSASPGHRRAQAVVLLAPTVVAAMNIAYLSGFSPLRFIDPTPLGFALGTLIIAHGVLERGLLELSPGLHRQIIAHLSDPVLVLDDQQRIMDLNPAAVRRLPLRTPGRAPLSPAMLAGSSIARLWPDHPFATLRENPDQGLEINLGQRAYHVSASRLGTQRDGGATALLFHDITERLRAEAELRQAQWEMERLAFSDPLTGLHNRRAFMQRLEEECQRSQRQQHPVSVILLDLDEFKAVNDSRGHEAGDHALQRVAELIGDTCRISDVAGRIGGEEFAVLLPGSFLEGARRLAERLRQCIEQAPIECPQQAPFHVSASIGVVGPSAGGELGQAEPSDLLRRADGALYRAKAAGRNRVCADPYAGSAAAEPALPEPIRHTAPR